MTKLTWLHLSDLHINAKTIFDSDIVLTDLLIDINERILKDGLRPDFIAVTGDIALNGNDDGYKSAYAFFQQLLQITGLPVNRLLVVPGNHDVDSGRVRPMFRCKKRSMSHRLIGQGAQSDRSMAHTLIGGCRTQ